VQKTIDYRLHELETGLRNLEMNTLGFMQTRDEAYLLSVKAMLRALVATGGRNLTPLLIDIAAKLEIPLEFYALPAKSGDPPAGLVSSTRVWRSWQVFQRPDLRKFVLREWLLSPAYFIDRTHQYATTNDVLRQLADTDGGAHFDLDIKNIVDSLRRSTGSRYDGLQFFLVEVSALVFWLGKRLLLVHDRRSKSLDFLHDAEIHEHDKEFDTLNISMM
jgi:hypothetical protein